MFHFSTIRLYHRSVVNLRRKFIFQNMYRFHPAKAIVVDVSQEVELSENALNKKNSQAKRNHQAELE